MEVWDQTVTPQMDTIMAAQQLHSDIKLLLIIFLYLGVASS
jgi:hypothetical protein